MLRNISFIILAVTALWLIADSIRTKHRGAPGRLLVLGSAIMLLSTLVPDTGLIAGFGLVVSIIGFVWQIRRNTRVTHGELS